jgi:hypothetical protein
MGLTVLSAKEAKMQRHIQPLLLTLLVLALTTLACGGGTAPSQDKTETPTQAEGSTQTMEPTSQLAPTLAATVDTTDCKLSAVFEADVTIPDNTRIEAGQSFVKTWRVRNTGTCDWGPGYRWTFVDGDRIGGPNSVSVPETQAGESAEISVELVAPAEKGQYRGYWQMCVNETECFGDRVYVQIVSYHAPRTITTSKGDFSVPGTAFMDGRDLEAEPPLTIMNINIWNAAHRQRVVCRLQHGTNVEVLDATLYSEEGRYYFQVRSGSCEGWVPESFLSPEYQAPVGDQIP